jgi:thymidylate synthase
MNHSIFGEQFQNANEAFESLYKTIMHTGEDYASTKAIFNVNFSLLNPQDKIITNPARKFSEDYAKFEYDWYTSGDRDATAIAERAKIWKQMMVPGTTAVVSNYGHFWKYNDQLIRVVNELKKNKESRRAVLVHYDLGELDVYKYDTPCNLALNFYIKDDKLNITILSRSIDLYFGFGNDQYCFARLLEDIALKLDCEIGGMHWHITNLHIYERHFNKPV